jgi:crotonobetainyl-CoA:carnitine CoA-transferase CaiB-like acyl-CoA transferase
MSLVLTIAASSAVISEGSDAESGGYDATAFWGRGGVGHALTSPRATEPVGQRPAFGDKAGAMDVAFGIAAALFRRERTGLGAVVDVSLLGSALWQVSSDIVYSLGFGTDFIRVPRTIGNPLTGSYRTKDGRWLMLTMLRSSKECIAEKFVGVPDDEGAAILGGTLADVVGFDKSAKKIPAAV